MKSKTIFFFIAIGFLLQFYTVERPQAQPVRVGTEGSGQEFFLTVSLPPKDRFTLVSVTPIRSAGKLLGAIAAYDEVGTPRPADYLELYNDVGALLAVSWFDRFGIERLAVDRALVEDGDKLKGVYVLLVTGDSV
jgi:hypothetical protein